MLCFSDGLTDCADSRCCSNPACKEDIMCTYLADPVEVLLRKTPPTVASSFLDRVRFLYEEKSVLAFTKKEVFDEK